MSSRSWGLRVIALLLAWHAVSGIWRAAMVLEAPPTSPGPLLFPAAQAAAAAAAAVTAVGLWRGRGWAASAYVVWAVLALIAYAPLSAWIGLMAAGPSGERLQSWWWLLPATAILAAGGVLYAGWRYIRRQLHG